MQEGVKCFKTHSRSAWHVLDSLMSNYSL